MSRFLFVTQTAHPWGGVESWLEELTAGLATEHQVTIGLVRGRRFHDPDCYRAARALRVPSIEIAAPTGTPEGRRRAIDEAIEATGSNVVVPVNIADVLEVVRRRKRRGHHLRLFYPLHGLAAEYLADVRAYAGVIDLAVASNRLAERALIEVSGMNRERVEYASYGAASAERLPIFDPSRPLRLVYSGRLEQEQKRVRDLVSLCRELDRRGVGYSLDIAGDGEESSFLRSTLSENSSVHFFGLLTREELYAKVYPRAQAMILLSAWETGPIVALEAMAHGATLVTTAYLGLRAEGRNIDGKNALVAGVGDVDALADAVQRLSEDSLLLDRLRRSAFETVVPACSVERSFLAWRSAFERGLSLPTATAGMEPPHAEPAGRLDRLVGASLAETIRAAVGRGMAHSEPGAEWPHTFGVPEDAAAINAAVAQLDR